MIMLARDWMISILRFGSGLLKEKLVPHYAQLSTYAALLLFFFVCNFLYILIRICFMLAC